MEPDVSFTGRRLGPALYVCVVGFAIGVALLLYFLITPRIVGNPDGAQHAKAQSDLSLLEKQVQQYRLDVGEYPESLSDLLAKPVHVSKEWRGPYRDRPIPMDPWGSDYDYLLSANGESFSIISYGRNGAPGGEGWDSDISLTGTVTSR